jgi:anti-anti-sigma factor
MDSQANPIEVEKTADGYKIAIVGAIHIATAWIEGELKKVVEDKPKRVDMDLSRMPFASSIGLGVLIAFRNHVVANGGQFHITAIQERVLGTIRFAHLQQLMNVDVHTKVVKATS